MFSSPTHHEAFFLSSSSLAPHSKIECEIREKSALKCSTGFCSDTSFVHAILGFMCMLMTRFHAYPFRWLRDIIFFVKNIIYKRGFCSFSAFIKAKISAWKARREYIVRSCFRQKPYCACINALTRRALRGIIPCGTRNEISLMHHPTRRLSVSPRLCSGYWYHVLSCHSQPSLALLAFHHILVQAKAKFSRRDENFHWQTIIKVEAREHYRKTTRHESAMQPLLFSNF